MTTAPSLVSVVDELVDRLGDAVHRDAPLGLLTTYRVGGSAAALVEIDDDASLAIAVEVLAGTDLPLLTVGGGSNLLVSDGGFTGVALQLSDRFKTIEFDGTSVRVGAAAHLPVVARQTAQAGLAGFEWAVGVPGSIGGAVRMNAGGHGSQMADSLVEVEVADFRTGELVRRPARDLELGYRSSALAATDLVVRAVLGLTTGDPEASQAQMTEIVQWRRANQPGGHNAGSVFTNPPTDSAGRLIDTAGAKGLRIGTAEVSSKHANFIQSDEGGCAADVVAVMAEVRRLVMSTHGIDLQIETHLVGFEDPVFGDQTSETRGMQG